MCTVGAADAVGRAQADRCVIRRSRRARKRSGASAGSGGAAMDGTPSQRLPVPAVLRSIPPRCPARRGADAFARNFHGRCVGVPVIAVGSAPAAVRRQARWYPRHGGEIGAVGMICRIRSVSSPDSSAPWQARSSLATSHRLGQQTEASAGAPAEPARVRVGRPRQLTQLAGGARPGDSRGCAGVSGRVELEAGARPGEAPVARASLGWSA